MYSLVEICRDGRWGVKHFLAMEKGHIRNATSWLTQALKVALFSYFRVCLRFLCQLRKNGQKINFGPLLGTFWPWPSVGAMAKKWPKSVQKVSKSGYKNFFGHFLVISIKNWARLQNMSFQLETRKILVFHVQKPELWEFKKLILTYLIKIWYWNFDRSLKTTWTNIVQKGISKFRREVHFLLKIPIFFAKNEKKIEK